MSPPRNRCQPLRSCEKHRRGAGARRGRGNRSSDPRPSANERAARFGETDHQRAGFDGPRLRQMVAQALGESRSRAEFDAKLATLGLRLRMGDHKDIRVVEAADGTVLGSLARLTGLRKTALEERMAFHERRQSTAAEHPSDDKQAPAAPGVRG